MQIIAALLAQVLLLLALASGGSGQDLLQRCRDRTGAGSQEMVVIFVADPGQNSGTPEALYFFKNLKDKQPFKNTVCYDAYTGHIMGQKTLVATTGMGALNALSCVQDILTQCAPLVNSIIWSGTAGWSSAVGGILNNGTCEHGVANAGAKTTRMGDVCVSPLSVNWDCRQASWSQTCHGAPNQCTYPQQASGTAQVDSFGQCLFTDVSKEQYEFSDQVISAASNTSLYPTPIHAIQAGEERYWDLMRLQRIADRNISWPQPLPRSGPTVWGYQECMEIDSQFFWSGAPWDMVARQYVAQAMNQAFSMQKHSKEDVIAVSAYEGIGFSQAMQNYYLTTGRRIPFTIVRAMSDRTHKPVMFDPNSQMWFTSGDAEENFESGFAYAVATSSTTVMSFLKARCLDMAKAGNVTAGTCSFTIAYP